MPDARWAPRRIAVLFAVGVVVVGALLPLGGGEATRIYLTDSNAERASGTIAVDVRLQLQGGFAPSEIRALLLAMNESWSIPKIVFYLDPAYPVAGPLDRINGLIDHLRPALSERHFAGRFEIVDAEGLQATFSSPERAVVVIATSVLPDTVFSRSVNQVSPWLRAGGVLVWTGDLIGAYVAHRGQASLSWNDTTNLRWEGEKQIFGAAVIGNLTGPPTDPIDRTPTAATLDLKYPIARSGANLTLIQNRSWLPLGVIYGATFAASSLSWIPVGNGGVLLFGSGPEMPFGYSAEDVVANDIAQTLMAGVPWWNLTLTPALSTVLLARGETRVVSMHFVVPMTVPFGRLYMYSTGPLRPAVLWRDLDFRGL